MAASTSCSGAKPSLMAHSATALATVRENCVNFATGGNVAAPGFVVSTIPCKA